MRVFLLTAQPMRVFLLIPFLLTVKACLPGQFLCNVDSRCIPEAWKCDHHHDCLDGSDEVNCTYNLHCREDEMLCKYSQQCVSVTFKCDGIPECEKQEDEEGCPGRQIATTTTMKTTPRSSFLPPSPSFVPMSQAVPIHEDWIEEHPMDHPMMPPHPLISNEELMEREFSRLFEEKMQRLLTTPRPTTTSTRRPTTTTMATTTTTTTRRPTTSIAPVTAHLEITVNEDCSLDEYKCQGKRGPHCIMKSKRCDNVKDCYLGDDEMDCEPTCSAKEVQCADHTVCIHRDSWCDGERDCPDGSDEWDCNVVDDEVRQDPIARPCASDEILCRDTDKCVKWCDGKRDCLDGSDELQCQPCKDNVCAHGCRSSAHGPICFCNAGFLLANDGVSCEADVDCSLGDHHCDHHCVGLSHDYKCRCEEGYQLKGDRQCRLVDSVLEGNLLISLGSKIVEMPLFNDHLEGASSDAMHTLTSSGQVRHLAYLRNRGKTFLAVRAGENGGELVTVDDLTEEVRVIRENITGIRHVAVDWLGSNVVFTAEYPSTTPGITVCSLNGFFCRQVIKGKRADPFDGSRRQVYRGLALHPARGLMFWSEVYQSSGKVMVSSMDGSGAKEIYRTPVTESSSLSALAVDVIRNDLFIGGQEWDQVVRLNIDTLTQSQAVSLSFSSGAIYDMAVFNGHLFWTDIDTAGSSKLQVAELVDHATAFGHEIMRFSHRVFGIAINHTHYQKSSHNSCSSIECPWVCVSVSSREGPLMPQCLCPDEYDQVDGQCIPPLVLRGEPFVLKPNGPWSHVGTKQMLDMCEEEDNRRSACLNGGSCLKHLNEYGRVVRVSCSCAYPFGGAHCEMRIAEELIEKRLNDLASTEQGHPIVLLLLLIVAIVAVVALCYFKIPTVRKNVDSAWHTASSEVQPTIERVKNIASRMPIGSPIPRSASTTVLRNQLYEDDIEQQHPVQPAQSASLAPPATPESFANPLYGDDASLVMANENTYRNKFLL